MPPDPRPAPPIPVRERRGRPRLLWGMPVASRVELQRTDARAAWRRLWQAPVPDLNLDNNVIEVTSPLRSTPR